jgi:tripartite ATP-independent transporter DctM subunit
MLADWAPAIVMGVLFALGTPIAFAIAISALSFFLISGDVPLNIFVQKMVTATDSYPLLAVPFFVLAGAIMNRAGITRKLLTLADAMVGHLTGALAQMCTVLATLLGGLTASSSADAAMLSKMLGPEMIKHNYSPAFAAVITSCAAIITALIPPSIGLILYGYIADVSVGRLFIGGILPGLLVDLQAARVSTTAHRVCWHACGRPGIRGRHLGLVDSGVHHHWLALWHLHTH